MDYNAPEGRDIQSKEAPVGPIRFHNPPNVVHGQHDVDTLTKPSIRVDQGIVNEIRGQLEL